MAKKAVAMTAVCEVAFDNRLGPRAFSATLLPPGIRMMGGEASQQPIIQHIESVILFE